MSQSLKDVRVEVKVKNNLILLMMEKQSITSVTELCRLMGKPFMQGRIGELVNMKVPARRKTGEWSEYAILLADFFRCIPEDIFSEPQQWDKLKTNRTHAEIGYAEIAQLTMRAPVTPELAYQADDLRRLITEALLKLTPREERIIRMRFGFNCEQMILEEIGDKLGVTRERIREIEAKALRKLKHPSKFRVLRSSLDDPEVLEAL